MTESELRVRLRAIDVDSDPMVEQRAWQVVRAAYNPLGRSHQRRRRRVTVPAVACMVAVGAVALATASPPGRALARWLREAIGLSIQPHPRPLLAGLPGGGQLLVNSPAGPWIVSADGRRHYLGRYAAAAWSPHSLYVIAWRATQLSALDPRGRPQWTLTAAGPISAARWSPDGYRIAYAARSSLWVVAGDGTGAHQLRSSVAPVAPAWQPHRGDLHRIAFVDQIGDLELLNADTAARAWRITPRAPPRQLLWSPDGTRLLTVGASHLSLYDDRGRLLATATVPTGETVTRAAFAAGDYRVALAIRRRSPAGDSIALLYASGRGLRQPPQIMFSVREGINGISWSPDDRWLLASTPSADQWIFIRTLTPTRLQAVSHIQEQFQTASGRTSGFPSLGGWQPPTRVQLSH